MSVDQFARIRSLLDKGQFDEAEALIDKAIKHNCADKASKLRVANCLAHLAHLLASTQNQLDRAVAHLTKARRLIESANAETQKRDEDDDNAATDESDDELLLVLYALGLMHQRRNDLAQSRAAFNDAVARATAIGRRESAQMVAVLSGLAVCDQMQDRALAAAKGFDQAVALQIKVGVASADAERALAELLHSCGAAYFQAVATRERGRLDERVSATARLERALQIREKLKDAQHVAELHLLIGTYLTSMKDDAAGEQRIARGTELMLAATKAGKNSGEFASCCEAKATALQMRGQHSEAMQALDDALAIYRRLLKGKSDDGRVVNCARKLLLSLDRVADELRSKDVKGALALAERALPLRATVHGEKSEIVAGNHVMIGTLAFEAGDVAAAKQQFQRALDLFTAVGGSESEPIGGVLFNLANVARSSNNSAEAIELYQRAKAVFGKLKQADKVQYIDRVLSSMTTPAFAGEQTTQVASDWKPFLLLTVLLTCYFAYRFN
jgi:tetratricopeptide (TPR) repeat protein